MLGIADHDADQSDTDRDHGDDNDWPRCFLRSRQSSPSYCEQSIADRKQQHDPQKRQGVDTCQRFHLATSDE